MRTFKIYSLSNLQIYNTVNYIHHAVGYILRTYSSHHWNFIPFDHTHSIYTQFEHTTLISLPRPKSYSHQSVFYNYEFRFCFLDGICMQAFLLAQLVKSLPAMRETWIWSLGWEGPLEKGNATISVFRPGEFHGVCSPWGLKESDTTEWLSLCFTYIHEIICYLFSPNLFHLA